MHLRENGNVVLSTDAAARLGNVDFSERDLIEYHRASRTATVLFDGKNLDAWSSGGEAAKWSIEAGDLSCPVQGVPSTQVSRRDRRPVLCAG